MILYGEQVIKYVLLIIIALFHLGGEFLTLDEIGDGHYVKAPSPTGSTHKESSI